MTSPAVSQSKVMSSRRKNQWKLMGIFAIAGVPVLLAMLMYFLNVAIPAGKTNKGVLISKPLSLSDLGFAQDERGLYAVNDGKWLILQTGLSDCAEACKEMLRNARQVNVLMGREQERVARLLLGKASLSEGELIETYPMLNIRNAQPNDLVSFYRKADVIDEAWHLWIVDPNGNVVLRYDESHSGYDLRDDLKKLLKLSKIG